VTGKKERRGKGSEPDDPIFLFLYLDRFSRREGGERTPSFSVGCRLADERGGGQRATVSLVPPFLMSEKGGKKKGKGKESHQFFLLVSVLL